jgi:hypothetical protein
MNRRYIGIELKRSYFDLAIRHLQDAERAKDQLDMFAACPSPARSRNDNRAHPALRGIGLDAAPRCVAWRRLGAARQWHAGRVSERGESERVAHAPGARRPRPAMQLDTITTGDARELARSHS